LFGRIPSAIYKYTDGDGSVLGYACRFENPNGGKLFSPLTPEAGDWVKKGFGESLPLYNQQELASRPDDPVLLVEGEKVAESAKQLFSQYVASTWPNGAHAAKKVDLSPLVGRDVTIWRDADEPGEKAEAVLSARLLSGIAKSVSLVALPANLPKGWDVADKSPPNVDKHALLANAILLDATLAKFAMTAAEFTAINLPEKEYIIYPLMTTQCLMMVFARRGAGKTWVAMMIALAIARGTPFLCYKVTKPRVILFWDGEMTVADIKERLKLLGAENDQNFLIMASEILFNESRSVNINNPDDQALIKQTLDKLAALGRRPEVVIFDNISSLGGGIDENDNSALESQMNFLRDLRHKRYSVVLIHHAGKSGDQRGASRREDILDTSIKLDKPEEEFEGDQSGASFVFEVVKSRGIAPRPSKMLLSLRPNSEGLLEFQMSETGKNSAPLKTLRVVFEGAAYEAQGSNKQKFRAFKSQKELAQTMRVSEGTVSKHLTQLRAASLIADLPNGQGIGITSRGIEKLKALTPNLRVPPPANHVINVQMTGDHDDGLV
jgi:KaiC/GvpD/RAD55 family RecA-like ATPase/5S rRNA maturation endonuclease (ribonuclease M5)